MTGVAKDDVKDDVAEYRIIFSDFRISLSSLLSLLKKPRACIYQLMLSEILFTIHMNGSSYKKVNLIQSNTNIDF